MGNLILAIDLGTTNCKTLLLDESLTVVDKVAVEYGLSIPQPGWAEQSPLDWWRAVTDSIRKITANRDSAAIKAVGLSGQMHGLVLLDAAGEVLRPAILWNDQRSFPQCEAIYETAGGVDGLLQHTNNPDPSRLHGRQAALGPGSRARNLPADRAVSFAKGLHPLPAHWELCH